MEFLAKVSALETGTSTDLVIFYECKDRGHAIYRITRGSYSALKFRQVFIAQTSL